MGVAPQVDVVRICDVAHNELPSLELLFGVIFGVIFGVVTFMSVITRLNVGIMCAMAMILSTHKSPGCDCREDSQNERANGSMAFEHAKDVSRIRRKNSHHAAFSTDFEQFLSERAVCGWSGAYLGREKVWLTQTKRAVFHEKAANSPIANGTR